MCEATAGGFDGYRQAIASFRDRDNRAVASVAPVPAAQLSDWVTRAIAELPPIDLKAAAILHSDIAIRRLRSDAGGGVNPHLDAAERLLESTLAAEGRPALLPGGGTLSSKVTCARRSWSLRRMHSPLARLRASVLMLAGSGTGAASGTSSLPPSRGRFRPPRGLDGPRGWTRSRATN